MVTLSRTKSKKPYFIKMAKEFVLIERGEFNRLNPIWTGLFAILKRLGGILVLPPTLAVSNQKTMNRNLYKSIKMFDNVIIMLIL